MWDDIESAAGREQEEVRSIRGLVKQQAKRAYLQKVDLSIKKLLFNKEIAQQWSYQTTKIHVNLIKIK